MASPISLNRLLTRLDHTLRTPDTAARLQHSPYERNRVGANIEHARAMLLTLEKQSATIRIQTQRQSVQAQLQSHRDWIKRLNSRLLELNSLGSNSHDSDSHDDDDDDDDDDHEDLLRTYAPARPDADAGLESGLPQANRLDPTEQAALRSRKPPSLSAQDNRGAASTSAREQLFGGTARRTTTEGGGEVPRTETMMSHNRTEQEALTNGLLGLARALKESSVQFGASLEAEKETLKRAEGGLDRNAQGMQAAEKKMSMLRRMSEGQGWWGRIKLYAFIFALWVACTLLVFIGPKLRF
jgi:hypothetical protein